MTGPRHRACRFRTGAAFRQPSSVTTRRPTNPPPGGGRSAGQLRRQAWHDQPATAQRTQGWVVVRGIRRRWPGEERRSPPCHRATRRLRRPRAPPIPANHHPVTRTRGQAPGTECPNAGLPALRRLTVPEPEAEHRRTGPRQCPATKTAPRSFTVAAGKTATRSSPVETADGQHIGTPPHTVRHSPSGMNWGYRGSGPCDTALSLLLAALGDDAICPLCQGSDRVIYTVTAGIPASEPTTRHAALHLRRRIPESPRHAVHRHRRRMGQPMDDHTFPDLAGCRKPGIPPTCEQA